MAPLAPVASPAPVVRAVEIEPPAAQPLSPAPLLAPPVWLPVEPKDAVLRTALWDGDAAPFASNVRQSRVRGGSCF
jgi:hypothetical protein